MDYQRASLAAESGRISSWLQQLEYNGTDGWDISAAFIRGDDEQRQDKTRPGTPPQKRQSGQSPIEISPTDTTFSGRTIFDLPECSLSGQSDTTQCPGADNVNADAYGTSTEFYDTASCDHETAETNIHNRELRFNDSNSNAESERLNQINLAFTDLIAYQRQDEKPVVRLLSCLQCTLKGLRCSRTLPACSRCLRAGCGELCLLTRRQLANETNIEAPGDFFIPVLLQLAEVDEKLWQEKVQLADELLQSWREKQLLKNWVLPNPNLGHLVRVAQPHGSRLSLLNHPGEGEGNVGSRIADMRLNLA